MITAETAYEPKRKTWTVEEYNRMADLLGITDTEQRYELINGEIYEKMSPQSTPHFRGILNGSRIFHRSYSTEFSVRVQVPLELTFKHEPEPDFSIVHETEENAEKNPPIESIVLVMEVSDTTLTYDRTTKLEIYARAGVAEYWILNVKGRRLEVHREPALTANGEGIYRSSRIVSSGEKVALPGLDNIDIAIDDLLPSARD